ncbi:MAG: hypothetical protein JSS70_12000 [Bacteroidetes bacterium]|nr:hypothetical protein [Bacteroidota bacterium]
MKKVGLSKIYPFFLVYSLLSAGLFVKAQNIDSTIAVYSDKYSQERMYLHFDKSSYSAGETVWFKVYMMDAIYPAAQSKSVYLDWTDNTGKLLLHSVFPMTNGLSNGQFEIPVDYKGNSLHVKGYTRWMLNFDSVFLYNKDIRIISRYPSTAKKETVVPSITFFPEGGDAIAGLNNKIAFKVNDQWGKPVKIRGSVVDSKGKVITALTQLHDGMGFFFLNPAPGISYSAKWKDEKGVDHTSALPEIKQSGIVMQVIPHANKRILSINCTPDAAKTIGTLHILGTMFQNTVFKIDEVTNKGSIQKTIPLESLPSGILTITVFDGQWNALAERITFVNNKEYLFQSQMEVKQWGLSKRAKDQIQITVPDSLIASLSVSVTDQQIDADSSNNIISHLLLTSDLKGKVYNPAYYFSSDEDSIATHLDLVMLTHGWRRFKWEDVVQGKFPKINYQRDTSYLSLSGKVIGALPAQLRGAGDVFMFVKEKDKKVKMLSEPIKPDGSFNDPTQIFFDTIHVYYSFPKKSTLADASIQFMDGRVPAPANTTNGNTNPFPDTSGDYRHAMLADEANSARRMAEGKILEEVIIKSKTKSPIQIMDEKYTSGFFSGGDGYQFDLVNDPFASSAMNIFTYLQGKVPGLQITTGGSGATTLNWRGGAPQLYLDEIQSDPGFLSGVNVNDVAYIKVFRPPFFGGSGGGANGAIAIYTRRGGDVKPTPGKGLNNNVVYGYTPIRQFYSPNYGTFDKRNEEKDFRTTIYWNPNVNVGPGKRQVTLSFYNNDVSDFFRVVIEGMSIDGRLTHFEQIME